MSQRKTNGKKPTVDDQPCCVFTLRQFHNCVVRPGEYLALITCHTLGDVCQSTYNDRFLTRFFCNVKTIFYFYFWHGAASTGFVLNRTRQWARDVGRTRPIGSSDTSQNKFEIIRMCVLDVDNSTSSSASVPIDHGENFKIFNGITKKLC